MKTTTAGKTSLTPSYVPLLYLNFQYRAPNPYSGASGEEKFTSKE
jgi:hypothetical protein